MDNNILKKELDDYLERTKKSIERIEEMYLPLKTKSFYILHLERIGNILIDKSHNTFALDILLSTYHDVPELYVKDAEKVEKICTGEVIPTKLAINEKSVTTTYENICYLFEADKGTHK